MLCAPLDWQYAELPSSTSDAVLCSVLVRKMWSTKTNRRKNNKKKQQKKQGIAEHGTSLVHCILCVSRLVQTFA